MTLDAPLKSAQRRRTCGRHGQAPGLPTPPTAEQKQKKRTFDVLPKPDNFIRYRKRVSPKPRAKSSIVNGARQQPSTSP